LLVQMFGQILSDQARADVGRTAGRMADQPTHRMIWIVIVRSPRRSGAERNCTAGKRQRRNRAT
jgi:hypothetical protein